jgi:hypothetical protein
VTYPEGARKFCLLNPYRKEEAITKGKICKFNVTNKQNIKKCPL